MAATPPSIQGYSFYLNVVVIGSSGTSSSDSTTTTPDRKTPERTTSTDTEPTAASIPEEEPAVENENGGGGAVIVSNGNKPPMDPKMKLLMETKNIYSAFTKNRSPKPKSNENAGPGLMSSIGKSISKRSNQLREGASRMVANKTMVSRAEKAVGECIPLVTKEIGVEMSISKRFQQGPVFVLEVDMKGCDLLELLEKVLGDEAATHYRNVTAGLEALGLSEAKEAFLKEILPKVRKGMMDKMAEVVPEKMNLKKEFSDLQIQVVSLEDAEEAKWLYNFLAFMEEMK